MAKIINTADLNLAAHDGDEQRWIYNGLDCVVTAEVRDNLLAVADDVALKTYDFSRALQAPVLEMNMRGLRVNQKRKMKVIADITQKITRLEAQLDSIIQDGIGTPGANWRSPKQLKELLYDIMQLPVQRKRNAAGVYAPTTDETALEKLANYFIAEPICNHILLLRGLGKSLGFLRTGVDADGRMRTQFNIAGTVTGRFASSATDFGTGCVRPTAEALTPVGWKKLSELKDGDIIAQYNSGQIEFVEAKFYWQDFDGELLFYNTEQVALAVTPGHRVLSSDYKDNWVTKSAQDTFNIYAQRKLPLSGVYNEGTKTVPAYLAMLMADCSKEGTIWRGAWKKDAKITRAGKLLDQAGIRYSENKARNGYTRYVIYADINLPKKYGPWVLNLTQESAKALVDEAKYWDAHIRGNSFIFYTADKEEAEWFQTLCHLVGYSTSFKWNRNSKEAYGNRSIIYTVNVKPRACAQVLRKHWKRIRYSGKVGCPQVPSSYWLAKENGFISITGNTNLQNVTESLRSVFIADEGMMFCNIDLEQGDSRNVGALCWNLFANEDEAFAGSYLNACESGDLHTFVSKIAFPHLAWGTAPDREIAEQLAHKHYDYRFMSKKVGHGSNYLAQPETVAKHARIPVQIAKDFQKAYFDGFPCIPAWHQSVFYALENLGYLISPFGRRRFFFGRPKEGSTRREAVAHVPQSMTGDEINTALLNLWRNGRVQLMGQVHDSILFQFPEKDRDEIVPLALELAKTKLVLERGREFIVPVEAKTGWNWGNVSDNNPDGLKKWKSGDERKRSETSFQLSLSDF